MGEGSHLKRIDPFRLYEGPGEAIDFLERVDCIDIALLHLQHDLQHVGRAKHLAILLIELNIGMRGRVEIEEVGMDAQVEGLIAEQQGAELDEEADTEAVTEQEVEVASRQGATVQFGPQRREHAASLLFPRLLNPEPLLW